MAVLPADIPTGLVTGHYFFVSTDNADVDTDPQLTPVTGVVRFTCSAKRLRMSSKKATIIPLVFEAKFSETGELVGVDDPSAGLRLPASNSPLFNPTDFTWKVEFLLKEAETGFTISVDGFDIRVLEGETVDLTEVMPVAESNGVPIIQGERGVQGEKGNKGDTGATPNIAIGNVVTLPNPGDDVWIADILRRGTSSQQAIRDTMPSTFKGDKGDTGTGWSPTTLGDVNLDTVQTVGTYRQPTASFATTANNYPRSNSGILEVLNQNASSPLGLIQRYTPVWGNHNSKIFWMRSLTGASWSQWFSFPSQRVDNTAGRAIYTWDDTANREQLIYGDTGKRNINDLINPIFTVTVAKIRRVINDVELQVQLNKPAGAGSGQLPVLVESGLPVGFRNQHTIMQPSISNGNMRTVSVSYLGKPFTIDSIPEGATTVFFLMKWSTTDAWPTTLPGTPDGGIPNA